MEDSAGAMLTRRPRVDSMEAAPLAEAARFTEAEDIMALVSDSVWAFTRPTDMPLQSAIPPDSTKQTACGNTIRVAPCRTDTKLDRVP
jgi:hypothetical protein